MADRETSTCEHPFASFCEAVRDLLVLNRWRLRRGGALVVLRWVDLHGVPAAGSAPEGGEV